MATSTDTPTPSAAPEPSRKRKAWLLGLLLLLVLAGIGTWAWYSLVGRWYESTDDAYVNGNVVEITPLITGTVTSIGADDGDLVHAGQVLLQFDPADSQVALQSAEANLARTVRQVRGLYSNVDSLKAQLATRQAELRKAQQDFNRRKVLADSGAIAAEELSHARDDLSVAQAAVNSARQQLSTSSALVGAPRGWGAPPGLGGGGPPPPAEHPPPRPH
ncbi:biotin/lipoyl-binding protein, partial [Pseudomonas juntendi]|uniref:biotin/lipoyl-binding protein n=1 Tax=Pseudomonas juntendi TaxID=2666183 RepID=UPI001E419D95